MRRRSFVASVVSSAVLTGCLRAEDRDSPGDGDGGGGEGEVEAEGGARGIPSGFDAKATLGGAPATEVETTVEGGFEFVGEGPDRVRVEREDGTVERGFEDWADGIATEAGREELSRILGEDLGLNRGSRVISAYGRLTETVFEDYRGDTEELRRYGLTEESSTLLVQYLVSVNREGETVTTPPVDYEDVVRDVPRTLTVSLGFDGRDVGYSRRYPVVVQRVAELV